MLQRTRWFYAEVGGPSLQSVQYFRWILKNSKSIWIRIRCRQECLCCKNRVWHIQRGVLSWRSNVIYQLLIHCLRIPCVLGLNTYRQSVMSQLLSIIWHWYHLQSLVIMFHSIWSVHGKTVHMSTVSATYRRFLSPVGLIVLAEIWQHPRILRVKLWVMLSKVVMIF